MKKVVLIISLISLSLLSFNSSLGRICFASEGKVITVKSELDLKGETLCIPKGYCLYLKKNGLIRNGEIKGDDAILRATRNCHFKDVVITGTWHTKNVYSEWFNFLTGSNCTNLIRNMFALCSETENNEVYFEEGEYSISSYDYEKNSPVIVRIPSKTSIHNKATFRAIPNDKNQSFLFYFNNVSDCLWEGGQIYGDLERHQGVSGEQGFAIALRGAKNIIIKNVTCSDCWGDGINLQYAGSGRHNENVTIQNVVCSRNRRQGLSIEDGVNVSVSNSHFQMTGLIRGTAPKYGIDIEPCYETAAIRNIEIRDCSFLDNVGGGVSCSFLKPTDGNIVITNCSDINGGMRLNECELVDTQGIMIARYSCENGKLKFKRTVQNVSFSDCSFLSLMNETDKEDVLSNITFRNLSLRTAEQRTWNFYCLSLICKELSNILFEDCRFEVLEGSSLSAVLPTGGDWSGVVLNDCTIIENREKPVYIPCDISNSTIETNRELVFTNHKKEGALLFKNNIVKVRGNVSDSPLVIVSSPNSEYHLMNNEVRCAGRTKARSVVRVGKDTKVSPHLVLESNSLIYNND